MNTHNKIIGILTTNNDYNSLINQNELLYEEIIKKFKYFYIIDLNKLLFFKKSKKKIFCKKRNIKYFEPKNSYQLINFLYKKKLVAFSALSVGFNYYRIHYILKKINLSFILLLNIAFLTNLVEFNPYGIKNFFSTL